MPIIPAFLQRKDSRLRMILFFVIALGILFLIIQGIRWLIPEERAMDAPYWYSKYPSIQLTSYENESYGTFFCSTQIRVAYTRSSTLKDLKQKEFLLLNAMIRSISEQNYYKINTDEKRRTNLTPILKKELNQVLGTPNAIVDLEYDTFLIEANKWNRNSSEYFGEFSIDLQSKKNTYRVLYYVLYDSTTPLFNQFLKRKRNDLESFVQNHMSLSQLESTLSNVFFLDGNLDGNLAGSLDRNLEESLKMGIGEFVLEYFELLEEEILREHPLYVPSQKLQSIFLSLFKSL